MPKPTLAISMGDPAGIGPEVTLKALAQRKVQRQASFVLVGARRVFEDTSARLGLDVGFCGLDEKSSARPFRVRVAEWNGKALPGSGYPRSRAAKRACGEASFRAIVDAFQLVQQGRADGLVTAPISKEHVTLAGHDIPGHTELLADLAGDVPVRMMMAGGVLRVVLATTHIALAEVPHALSSDRLVETLRITADCLRQQFGIAKPTIAVAGLNPHAGEGGKFGDEEKRIIAPAIRRARRARIDAIGPLAADGIFAHAADGRYDAVVCMYHDQGLGPFKLLHFADGVNCTLGLPFVRTSPDHGTAFDIAGTGQADAGSMCAAIELAARLVGSGK